MIELDDMDKIILNDPIFKKLHPIGGCGSGCCWCHYKYLINEIEKEDRERLIDDIRD